MTFLELEEIKQDALKLGEIGRLSRYYDGSLTKEAAIYLIELIDKDILYTIPYYDITPSSDIVVRAKFALINNTFPYDFLITSLKRLWQVKGDEIFNALIALTAYKAELIESQKYNIAKACSICINTIENGKKISDLFNEDLFNKCDYYDQIQEIKIIDEDEGNGELFASLLKLQGLQHNKEKF